jgi:hypothetical protein
MSHFTTVNTQIKDIAALRAACAELGLEVIQSADGRTPMSRPLGVWQVGS